MFAAEYSALESNVLVLNKHYAAVRVVSARRALTLLFREIAEIVAFENSQYLTYDFQSWRELSEYRSVHEREDHEWIRCVKFELAVPRIIRLLFYDRLPRQPVKFNRRNIFARDRNRCQYCGKRFTTSEAEPGSRRPAQPRRRGELDQYRLLLREVQRAQGRPSAGGGGHEADRRADQAQTLAGGHAAPDQRKIRLLAAVPRHRVLERRTAGLKKEANSDKRIANRTSAISFFTVVLREPVCILSRTGAWYQATLEKRILP